ncbi:MAG: type 1 glutamine amidotransferase [Candidatus Omnitrophota bacterium]|jgi:type 1 glutamine amidotransferase
MKLRFQSLFVSSMLLLSALITHAVEPVKIVLVAGAVKQADRSGHHDYLGGCRLLQDLLQQTPGVEAVLVQDGWPNDEQLFNDAKAIVFYTDGGGKQAYLASPERIAQVQRWVDAGIGLVSLHQAVEFPPALASQSLAWTGGVYTKASSRGHWDSVHQTFPDHPIARGVVAWKINDGWLKGFTFPEGLQGITPLVWSSKEHGGANTGGHKDVVVWSFDRPDGGRSFNFSGLDAHAAWHLPGMRKLMVNGVLWTAGVALPESGASCLTDAERIDSYLTPRGAPEPLKLNPFPASK